MNHPTFYTKHMDMRAIFLWAVSFLLFLPIDAKATASQIHLSWQNDPATTMTVVWSTTKNHTPPQVQYGTTLSYGNMASGVDSKHGTVLHTVELTGLTPDTLYHYRVGDDDGLWSGDMTFRTAPVLGESGTGGLVVTVTGDKGPYSDAQAVNQQIAAQNADLHLIVGDLAYTSSDDRYHEWFDKQQDYARFAPIMPAWGNHDTTEKDPPYAFAQAHFALPTHATKDKRYYSYTVGNAHFVAADSNTDAVTAPGSPQHKWLENDLAAAAKNPKIAWIIVYFHHNIYSAGGKYSDTATPVREHFQPLFDRYGVDLVFHGHVHYYSRSMPVAYNEVIKDKTHTPGTPNKYIFNKDHGQIYITTGGGGKPLYDCPDKLPVFIIQCADAYSFGTFTINGPTLTYKAIRSDGTILDPGFTLIKSVGNGKNTLQFNPIDDTMVDETVPSRSYGHTAQMEVDKMEKGGKKVSYLKFNVTGISESVIQAKLQLTTANIPFADSDSTGLIYHVPDTTWAEKTVNWNNRPAHEPSPLVNNRSKVIGKNEPATFDLSSVIIGNGLYSFALSSDSTDGVVYNTKEAKEGQPVLTITWGKQASPPPPSPPQKSETVTRAYLFNPIHDGYVREASPKENYGNSTTLSVDQKSNGGEIESYLMFNVTGITGTVVKATLKLKTKNHPDAESDQSGLLYTVESNQWDQNSLTWKNRPSRSTTPIEGNLSDPIGVDQTKEFYITSVIKKEGLYSFAIASTSSNGVLYRSKEDSGAKPVIEIVVELQHP